MNNIWSCPLTKRPDCVQAHAISTDGGLKHYDKSMQIELGRLGWQQVNFPKRDYYMEFDHTHPSYRERELIGMDDSTEVLAVDVL